MSRTTLRLDGDWRIKSFPYQSLTDSALSRLAADESWIPARVPGDVHAALLDQGIIPDPLFSDNARGCEWVTRTDRCFARTFSAEGLPRGRRLSLLFHGLDTYCSIWLNGIELGKTDNMFREHRFNVTDRVHFEGENRLLLLFSAIRPRIEELSNEKYVSLFNAERIFVRKAQCQFGWDWAPDLPSVGIWRGCALEAVDEREILGVQIVTRRAGSVSFFVEIDLPPSRTELDGIKPRYDAASLALELSVAIRDRAGAIVATGRTEVSGGRSYLNLRVDNPRLWWPNGLGEPYLYGYEVELWSRGNLLDRAAGKLGIREVELLQEPTGPNTLCFLFRINGVPVFCKGANWVPADLFPGVARRERYQVLIERAVEARFNMLRVWGGGIYEHDEFYELCDEQGLMVWQDFMSSCSDLPGDRPAFEESFSKEVEYQVRRLRNRPCIVYWTGGNETAGTAGYRPVYGDRLLHTVIRGICGDLDPTRPYGASSPSTFGDLGSDQSSGDSHISAFEPVCVSGGGVLREELRKIRTRFNSESAYMGPPRYRSLVRYMPQDSLWPPNELWDYRNRRNPYSWMLKDSYSQIQVRVAEDLFGEITGVKDFLKKAMTAHAELLSAEIEYHRSRKWENSGVLFWMYNDMWPTGTFSVIDYYLLPKPAFYAVKRAYRPLLLTIQQGEAGIHVIIANDLQHAVEGDLEVNIAEVGRGVNSSTKKAVHVDASSCLAVLDLNLPSGTGPDTYCFARFASSMGETTTHFFPQMWRDVHWPEPSLRYDVAPESLTDGWHERKVNLRTTGFARMVALTHPEDTRLVYSDNYFDLPDGAEKTVCIRSREPFDAGKMTVGHWLTEWD
jgi:beta-mannosidase